MAVVWASWLKNLYLESLVMSMFDWIIFLKILCATSLMIGDVLLMSSSEVIFTSALLTWFVVCLSDPMMNLFRLVSCEMAEC